MYSKWLAAVAVGIMCLVVGCAGSEFGGEVRVPVEERHILAAGSPAGGTLSLPADRGFNIHVKLSSQNPGSAGEARGESDAMPDGTARAVAEAGHGGSATGEFKLGHRIDNHAEAPRQAQIGVNFTLDYEVSATEPPGPGTLAKGDLFLVVLDSRQRAVSKTTVVQATSDDAVGRSTMRLDRLITVRLEPRESYDVVLFGRVEAATDEAQKSAARVSVQQFAIKFEFAPAQTQPAAP